ncbi:hypothetical protein [Methylobacterium sp. WCS2018Hpa-22]|uniref:hypothetical protein n=1 Tax=Methylobacterium sp. WCS2018Hpa-22 TaxID=3073633 RepID=UPI00288A81E1|nr:hypothetical protein [Methylobacterium sp. WCS2018Hpa-22]
MARYTNEEALRRIRAAYADRERIKAGWTPGQDELADAPVLFEWSWTRHPDHGLRCVQGAVSFPVKRDTSFTTTSPVVAVLVDEDGNGWARTWSRFYVLVQADDPSARPGLVTTRDNLDTDTVAFELGYRAPRFELEPWKPLYQGDADAWGKLRTWFEEFYEDDAQQAFDVYLARREGCSLDEARVLGRAFAEGWAGQQKSYN